MHSIRVSMFIFAAALAACAHSKRVDPDQPKAQEGANLKAAQDPGEPVVASSPKSIFESGTAKKIQRALADRGFNVPASGKIDSGTRTALAKFQESEGLAATGLPDRETLKRLNVDPDDVFKKADDQNRVPDESNKVDK